MQGQVGHGVWMWSVLSSTRPTVAPLPSLLCCPSSGHTGRLFGLLTITRPSTTGPLNAADQVSWPPTAKARLHWPSGPSKGLPTLLPLAAAC